MFQTQTNVHRRKRGLHQRSRDRQLPLYNKRKSFYNKKHNHNGINYVNRNQYKQIQTNIEPVTPVRTKSNHVHGFSVNQKRKSIFQASHMKQSLQATALEQIEHENHTNIDNQKVLMMQQMQRRKLEKKRRSMIGFNQTKHPRKSMTDRKHKSYSNESNNDDLVLMRAHTYDDDIKYGNNDDRKDTNHSTITGKNSDTNTLNNNPSVNNNNNNNINNNIDHHNSALTNVVIGKSSGIKWHPSAPIHQKPHINHKHSPVLGHQRLGSPSLIAKQQNLQSIVELSKLLNMAMNQLQLISNHLNINLPQINNNNANNHLLNTPISQTWYNNTPIGQPSQFYLNTPINPIHLNNGGNAIHLNTPVSGFAQSTPISIGNNNNNNNSNNYSSLLDLPKRVQNLALKDRTSSGSWLKSVENPDDIKDITKTPLPFQKTKSAPAKKKGKHRSQRSLSLVDTVDLKKIMDQVTKNPQSILV